MAGGKGAEGLLLPLGKEALRDAAAVYIGTDRLDVHSDGPAASECEQRNPLGVGDAKADVRAVRPVSRLTANFLQTLARRVIARVRAGHSRRQERPAILRNRKRLQERSLAEIAPQKQPQYRSPHGKGDAVSFESVALRPRDLFRRQVSCEARGFGRRNLQPDPPDVGVAGRQRGWLGVGRVGSDRSVKSDEYIRSVGLVRSAYRVEVLPRPRARS